MEGSIQGLNDVEKELSHQECTLIMRKSKPRKSILNQGVLLALKTLRNNDKIGILEDDQSGYIVVMNKEDYNSKMRYHLHNSGCYNRL